MMTTQTNLTLETKNDILYKSFFLDLSDEAEKKPLKCVIHVWLVWFVCDCIVFHVI